MQDFLNKIIFSITIFSAGMIMLAMAGCDMIKKDKKETSYKPVNTKKETPSKKNKASKKKKSKKNSNIKKLAFLSPQAQNNEENDIVFLDNISTEKALKAQEEISKLIAMLEEENKNIQPDLSFEKPYRTVMFNPKSTEIAHNQAEAVKKNTEKALTASKSGKKFILRGHSDAIESDYDDSVALHLAQKRAEAVKEELVQSGIDANNIEIAAIGSTEPLVFNFDKDHQEKNIANRRVEIITI